MFLQHYVGYSKSVKTTPKAVLFNTKIYIMVNPQNTPMKDLSGNDLSELQALTYKLSGLIYSDFSHVSDHLPASLVQAIDKYRERLSNERERRESKF